MPRPFDEIYALAAERKGGPAALEALLSQPADPSRLRALGDDRWLSEMSKRVFQAGFNWSVVEKKWPDFERAFEGFEPARWALASDEDLDRLLADRGIVRHAVKIRSVFENARFLVDLARQTGGPAGRVFADWPAEDYVGLLDLLKRRGARLGGTTAQYLLRFLGKESFVLSKDVTAALIREGVIDKPAGSKTALAKVQAAFNAWSAESGRSLTEVSQVLARSSG
ncbi:MAG: DNA-3-methyladenine glycosylase I [Rhodospirillales bacterium]